MNKLKGREQEIISLWNEKHLSLSLIAKEIGVSRQAIYKLLVKSGIDTSKATGCRIDVICMWCNSPFQVIRSRYNRTKHGNYCSEQCYTSYMNELGQGYKQNRQGQRYGRRVVESIYGPLPNGSVVHHIDKNTWNNSPYNLILFATQGDHVAWHRGDDNKEGILWDGRMYTG